MIQDLPDPLPALTQAVKAEAHRLGFQLAGVTTPHQPPHLDVFERWLGEARHGEMHYLASETARQRRANPRLILPEAGSVLVLGMRYPPSATAPPQPGKGVGRVASYAWGTDYHLLLPERLKALVAFLQHQIGGEIPNRWYTDTGPVLERDLAQRAGLGWIGKNTCLIHPAQGSYFFLAEIFLGIELAVDPPFQTDHCGTCTRCLEACPTGCILPDRTLDARRCIAYQTIELKGAIQQDLRQNLGEWIFGCDICQQVCPWNQRFASPQAEPAFSPRENMPWLDLGQVLDLAAQDFNRLFIDSPLKRAKRRGLLRNAAVALGNLADPASIPILSNVLLHDPEPLVRGHAAWALGQIGSAEAQGALRQGSETETDPMVQEEIRRASR